MAQFALDCFKTFCDHLTESVLVEEPKLPESWTKETLVALAAKNKNDFYRCVLMTCLEHSFWHAMDMLICVMELPIQNAQEKKYFEDFIDCLQTIIPMWSNARDATDILKTLAGWQIYAESSVKKESEQKREIAREKLELVIKAQLTKFEKGAKRKEEKERSKQRILPTAASAGPKPEQKLPIQVVGETTFAIRSNKPDKKRKDKSQHQSFAEKKVSISLDEEEQQTQEKETQEQVSLSSTPSSNIDPNFAAIQQAVAAQISALKQSVLDLVPTQQHMQMLEQKSADQEQRLQKMQKERETAQQAFSALFDQVTQNQATWQQKITVLNNSVVNMGEQIKCTSSDLI